MDVLLEFAFHCLCELFSWKLSRTVSITRDISCCLLSLGALLFVFEVTEGFLAVVMGGCVILGGVLFFIAFVCACAEELEF